MTSGARFGLGDVLFNGMLLAAVLLGVYAWVSEYVDRKRREERVRAAREFEIGDGVTLLRGVQAYFGEDGFWCARDDGTVMILAGTGERRACLALDPETESIRVISYNWQDSPENEAVRQALVGLMVQAAKDQNKVPGT